MVRVTEKYTISLTIRGKEKREKKRIQPNSEAFSEIPFRMEVFLNQN